MNLYTSFDFLGNESRYFEGIGTIHCPSLREIHNITYSVFSCYLNILLCTQKDYLKLLGIEEQFAMLPDKDKTNNTLYRLILYSKPDLLLDIISFFADECVKYDEQTESFQLYSVKDETTKTVGNINNDNFEDFRMCAKRVLGLVKQDEAEIKFKNDIAKRMFEKLQSNTKKPKHDENYTLDNMIKKYCTHNKVGINILNVWDLSYYQFSSMFSEYCNGRQCDFKDMMAANTFSYKKSSDYKPLEFMKTLNND